MNSVKLTSSPLAQLTYLIPGGTFNVANETDVAALHVMEHLILDGGERFTTSSNVFREARRLGGSITATVSRKSLQLKLTHYAPLYEDAMTLLRDLVETPKFCKDDFDIQVQDVAHELTNDTPINILFDELYAKLYSGRYGLSGGGKLSEVQRLKTSDVNKFLNAYRTAEGAYFWAGPASYEHVGLPDSEAPLSTKFEVPLMVPGDRSNVIVQDAAMGIIALYDDRSFESAAALGAYLRVEHGNLIMLHTHVLPEKLLYAISFDKPELDPNVIARSINRFDDLSSRVLKPYVVLASTDIMDETSYAAGASRIQTDGFINRKYADGIRALIRP